MRRVTANRRSLHSHSFSNVPSVKIPRSSFDRSHTHKTTFDAGWLIPVLVDIVYPGDTFNVNSTFFARLATPLKPTMDQLHLDSFFFAVPCRLLWENWERMHGAQDDPGDSIDYTVPQFVNGGGGVPEGSLHDYMGIPTGVDNLPFSCLPARAYNLIWNEWFRDQNLQDSVRVDTGDAQGGTVNDYVLLRRGKRHDYFTSCLPWPQKGDAVSIPLGTTAPVVSTGDGIPEFQIDPSGSSPTTGITLQQNVQTSADNNAFWSADVDDGLVLQNVSAGWDDTKLEADLSSATAQTINALRLAFQTQRMLERDARAGTRINELILSHYGVDTGDARVQRPEYLGGGSTPLTMHPVAQTSSGNFLPNTPLGDLAGFGTITAVNHGFNKSFTEHCVVLGLISVRADLTYQQGLERFWSDETRYDHYYPSLAMLGEQEVLNKEIYADGSAADNDVFGYQERYGHLRYKPSRISGAFRSNAATPLDYWHLSQDFANLPVLGDTFIQDNPPVDRVIATPDEPHFILDSHFQMRCARPMPMFGVPGMIDHF